VLLELFFDFSGIVHMEFVPGGAAVNKHCYREAPTAYVLVYVSIM
jgi:hypothetical protein